MPVKPPSRGVTQVEVHTPPSRPANDHRPRPDITPQVPPINSHPATHPDAGRLPLIGDLNAITPAPPLIISEIPHSAADITPTPPSIANYHITLAGTLPAADAQGLRHLKGRMFVDTYDGHILHVGLDPDSGLYRAKQLGELKPSGPTLFQDPQSLLWHALDDFDPLTLPLPHRRLENFRTALDFSATTPDSDGLQSFEGKRYVVIEGHAYQVMRDLDASSPEHTVWRIVNSKDPVASDSENIYRGSRAGETLAITRNIDQDWVSSVSGLQGGMRRTAAAQGNVAFLLQRYEPIKEAFHALESSSLRFEQLWSTAQHLPTGSDVEKAALIGLEVHIIKHTRMQAEYVQSLIDNKDWLILLKAGGVYKTELHTQQLNRVDFFNKLIAIMDRRVYPTLKTMTVEALTSNFAHLNKKLKILDDRQTVMDQIRKASRSAASELEELNRGIPDVDQVNYSKFSICLRLLSDDPQKPPPFGARAYMAMHFFVEDLQNVSGSSQPITLQLALEEIRLEKGRFDEHSMPHDPARAPYLQEAKSLLGTFESRIDSRLNDLYARIDSNIEWPTFDQDIDFDFVPQQPIAAATPVVPRKVFRTRQHGTDRVLVGIQETEADGTITVKVPDPFKPDGPPQRYEKRQGEWQPRREASPQASKPQLLDQATHLLARVEGQLAEGRAMEDRKSNPTNIRESLDKGAEELHGLAKRLEETDAVANDAQATAIVERLKAAGDSLNEAGRNAMVRLYKNKDVLDVLRLNYLLDHSELNVIKTVERKQLGKGKDKSFLDVYSINDRSGNTPLWEAHFHYDRRDRQPLDYTVKGAHLKTLAQAGIGSSFQQRQEQAGLAHQPIWRELISPKVAQKLFAYA